MSHLTDEVLDAFVSGTSTAADASAVSRHVRDCGDCAAKLQRFALHEEQLHAVAATASRHRSPRRVLLWGAAIAAGIVLAVVLARSPVPVKQAESAEAIPPVICPDGPDQRSCVKNAHRKGLVLAYPIQLSAPPIGAESFVVYEWHLE